MKLGLAWACLSVWGIALHAQTAPAAKAIDRAAVIQRGCELLLELQEGEGHREWPYEGVYRTAEPGSKGEVIPIGYRVGGTAIVCLALVEAPGYADEAHAARREAVERGTDFILEALGLPRMKAEPRNEYDVRGWGFIYALQLFTELEQRSLVPPRLEKRVKAALPRLVDALEETSLEKAGGWNYAGRIAPAPFMTVPALLALFEAAADGKKVAAKVVSRALESLERSRTPSGGITYNAPDKPLAKATETSLDMMDKLEGAGGRMVASEAALVLGGAGDQERLAASVESFFANWQQLEARRQKEGTHEEPCGVAPYYFLYAHYHAALAIELLEDHELRDRQRARLDELLARVQDPDGSWNDRVFPRSRAWGTATAMLALMLRDQPATPGWKAPAKR